jgi:Skp family chaperone for outer membrane proteins
MEEKEKQEREGRCFRWMPVLSALCTLSFSFLFRLPCANAIEISLEQNRTEHSSIGFVDMQRLFQAFPETQRARESFQEVVEKTQEQLNQQKAQILRLQNTLADLQTQREELMQGQQAPPETPPAVPPAVSTEAAVPAVAASTQAPSVPVAASSPEPSGYAVKPSTPSVFPALPGVPSAEITPAPAETAAPAPIPAVAVSSPAATAPPQVSSAAAASAPAAPRPLPVAQLSSDVRQKLASLDSQIAVTDQEIKREQADYGDREAAAEKNLVDLEGNKTDILLGEINKAIQIVADQEGISVVVDKGNILYGHDAVDLTDKVLKQLQEMR